MDSHDSMTCTLHRVAGCMLVAAITFAPMAFGQTLVVMDDTIGVPFA